MFDYVFREMVEGDDSASRRETDQEAPERARRAAALWDPRRRRAPFVERFGLTLISDLQPDDLAQRYLRRADGSTAGRPYGFSALAHARVAPLA